MDVNKIYEGDALTLLKTFPSEIFNTCVTSPPYYGLRVYGTNPVIWDGDENCQHEWYITPPRRIRKESDVVDMNSKQATNLGANCDLKPQNICSKCGAWRGELGSEPTPELFVKHIVDIFREVKRTLKNDGTLWLNLGDSYAGGGGASGHTSETKNCGAKTANYGAVKSGGKTYGLKPKDLIGIPWMCAFALRADGWWLRQDIIWCISGGTYVYAKTQKGVMPVMIRDLARLKPNTVELWNGKKWTKVLGMSKSKRNGNEIELVLRSGERISITPNHKFPTQRGLLESSKIIKGDALIATKLPETEDYKDCVIDKDAAWLAGLYIAEGSMAGDTIQISGHSKETERWNRLQKIATKLGGHITKTTKGNCMFIRLYGKILNAIISELVSGRIAKDKGFAPTTWNYSNEFLSEMLEGYLSGDGHLDKKNNRWRLGFTRNYNLERDLRTVCARLGYNLILKLSTVKYKGTLRPTFKGEIRKSKSNHLNNKNPFEIIEIRKARCREVYDIGIADEPHLFSLASGILTHNSKPNPMPESVTDRCTKAHEYIFLLSKSAKYYYDAKAIATPYKDKTFTMFGCKLKGNGDGTGLIKSENWGNDMKVHKPKQWKTPDGWDTAKGSHGTIHREGREKGFKGYEHQGPGDKTLTGHSGNFDAEGNLIGDGLANKKSVWTVGTQVFSEAHFATFPEKLIVDCIKAGCPEGGLVFDPFGGANTTGVVSRKINRNYVAIELNPKYIEIGEKREHNEIGLFK